MKTASNAERMRRLFDEAWNDGDLAVVEEVVADSFRFSRGGDSREGGPELYAHLIDISREMFPDMHYTVEDLFVGEGGSKVAVRWEMAGTHEGTYQGVEPTGEHVEMQGLEINHFADGQLVETWTHPNWVGFLETVGALPLGSGE